MRGLRGVLVARALVLPAALAAAGCGDPLAPADFSAPPAAIVSGSVVRELPGMVELAPSRPRMTMTWLDVPSAGLGSGPTSLVVQPVSYARSAALATDWDLGFSSPAAGVTFASRVGAREVRLAVGRVVYYDDRVADEQLDWSCAAEPCDRVHALSVEYAVFVEAPPVCEPAGGGPARPRLSAGYHTFTFAGEMPREAAAGAPLTFVLRQQSPAEGDPRAELAAFAAALLKSWSLAAVGGGC